VAPNPPSNLFSAIKTAGTPAVINDLIGLLIDGVSITITDLINVHTPDPILGNTVGFIISKPGAPLLPSAVPSISIFSGSAVLVET